MPIITLSGGKFCRRDILAGKLIEQTKYELLTDADVVAKATEISGIEEGKFFNALKGNKSVFNKFTHEIERSIAYLKLGLVNLIHDNDLLISGAAGYLLPNTISHILRVCLIADFQYRVKMAQEQGIKESEAITEIKSGDTELTYWVNNVAGVKDAWDPVLYDILAPTDKTPDDEIVSLIMDNLTANVIRPTEMSRKAEADFELAAKVEVELINHGHLVNVAARDGDVTLTINKNVLFLKRLEDELKKIIDKIPGVKSVETRVGKGFYKHDIYRNYDFKLPRKVLLVDDEREFVKTLSDRLLMRDMGSAIAYDGESALDIINSEEPEVMILDLKMPGIDGIEVLKKAKEQKPDVEIIILTGHGSEKDRKTCLGLGAFAYLHKPVNINLLSETVQKAYEKHKQNKEQ